MRISKTISAMSTSSMIEMGRKHAAKLSEHPNTEVGALAPGLLDKIDQLERARVKRRPLVNLWVETRQATELADDDVDTDISAMSYELLGPHYLKGDRDAKEYRALFSHGHIGFINNPIEEELTVVNHIVEYLSEHPEHPMAHWASSLKIKSTALHATLAPKKIAEDAYREARDTEQQARAELGRALRKSVFFLRAEMRDSTNSKPGAETEKREDLKILNVS